jgi:hypothetical protein
MMLHRIESEYSSGQASTPPPQPASMEFPTLAASEELGLPVQPTSVHPELPPLRTAAAGPSRAVAGPSCPPAMAAGAGWLLPSSPVLDQAPVQSTPSHPAGEAEPQAATPSPNGSTAVAGFSGTASTPISPPSVISSFGIIAPASPTPTPTSLWRNGRHPVASNGSTTTDEGQTSCNLNYSEGTPSSKSFLAFVVHVFL